MQQLRSYNDVFKFGVGQFHMHIAIKDENLGI